MAKKLWSKEYVQIGGSSKANRLLSPSRAFGTILFGASPELFRPVFTRAKKLTYNFLKLILETSPKWAISSYVLYYRAVDIDGSSPLPEWPEICWYRPVAEWTSVPP